MANSNTLAGSVASLTETFETVTDLFNHQKDDLAKYMDDNVVLVTVEHHTPYTGRTAVMQHLKEEEFRVNARFTPTTMHITKNATGNVAHILGTAEWKDNDGDIDGNIQYSFNFIKKNDKWLMSNLWGSKDH